MKYCSKCGQKISDDAMRCSACHHFTGLFWLTLFNSVGWVVFVALVYGVFARFTPALATIFANVSQVIHQPWRFQFQMSNVILMFGPIFIDMGAVLVLAAAVASREFPRFRKVLTPFLCIGLLLMAALVLVDSICMDGVAGEVEAMSWQTFNRLIEERGLDATRRIIAAEYRYRELHTKAGFTCDFEPLEVLGGPEKAVYPGAKSGKGILDVNGYLLYLSHCAGNPVSHYHLAAVPGFKGRAFCSDGSNIVYASKDGKATTCLETREPVP